MSLADEIAQRASAGSGSAGSGCSGDGRGSGWTKWDSLAEQGWKRLGATEYGGTRGLYYGDGGSGGGEGLYFDGVKLIVGAGGRDGVCGRIMSRIAERRLEVWEQEELYWALVKGVQEGRMGVRLDKRYIRVNNDIIWDKVKKKFLQGRS